MERIKNMRQTPGYTEAEFHNAVIKHIKTLNLIPGITPVLSTMITSQRSRIGNDYGRYSLSLVYPYISYTERKNKYIYVPLKVDYTDKDGVITVISEPEEVVSQNDVDELYDILKEYLGIEMFNKIAELELEDIVKNAYPKTQINAKVDKYEITVIVNGDVSVSIDNEELEHINRNAELVCAISSKLEHASIHY